MNTWRSVRRRELVRACTSSDTHRFFGLGMLASAALGFFHGEAQACPNATQKELDAGTKLVLAADDALNDDNLALARKKAQSVVNFWTLRPEYRSAPRAPHPAEARGTFLVRRAHRVNALAVSRDPASRLEERTEAEQTLVYLTKANPDPTLEVDAAEAMSTLPEMEPLALMMLRARAEKDLIGSAHAYAALERMEAHRGNEMAASVAHGRCLRMAKHPAICAP